MLALFPEEERNSASKTQFSLSLSLSLSSPQAGILPAHPRLYLEAARNRAAAEQTSTSREDDGTSDTPSEPSSIDETNEKS